MARSFGRVSTNGALHDVRELESADFVIPQLPGGLAEDDTGTHHPEDGRGYWAVGEVHNHCSAAPCMVEFEVGVAFT